MVVLRIISFVSIFCALFPGAAAQQELVDKYLEELDGMIGLDDVKKSVQDIIHMVRHNQRLKEAGHEGWSGQAMHMAFLGNPGTGKTVVARIVGGILTAMGAIKPPPVTPLGPDKGDLGCK